jgi:hypothetical protein
MSSYRLRRAQFHETAYHRMAVAARSIGFSTQPTYHPLRYSDEYSHHLRLGAKQMENTSRSSSLRKNFFGTQNGTY